MGRRLKRLMTCGALAALCACTPDQRAAAGRGALAAAVNLAKCAAGSDALAGWVSAEVSRDPAVADRLRASLRDGQALREDVACALWALASASTQDGETGRRPERVAVARAARCADVSAGCDLRSWAAAALVSAQREGLVTLPDDRDRDGGTP